MRSGEARAPRRIPQRVAECVGLERDRADRQVVRVTGETDERAEHRLDFAHEAAEIPTHEGGGQFARAIGAEIHEDHGVAVAHRHAAANHGRLHEFVALAARIRVGARRLRRGACSGDLPAAIACQASSTRIPALVAIHRRNSGPKPSRSARGEGCHTRGEPLTLAGALCGGGVAPSSIACTANRAQRRTGSQVQQREDVVFVTVYAPGDRAQEVRSRRLQRVVHGATQRALSKKLPVPDRLVDRGQLLVHHAAAPIFMCRLGVAICPLGQPTRNPACR